MSSDTTPTHSIALVRGKPLVACIGHLCGWYDWPLDDVLADFEALRAEHQRCAETIRKQDEGEKQETLAEHDRRCPTCRGYLEGLASSSPAPAPRQPPAEGEP